MLALMLMLTMQTECDFRVIEGRIELPTGTHEAVAIARGKVREVGKASDMPSVPATCRTRLADDQTAFPGLTDSHVHLLGIGLREMTLNLDSARSVEDVKRALARTAEEQPEGAIIGRGWIETGWPEGRALDRRDLDEIVSDRPVLLTRADGHAMAVNTATLEAAGIDADTEDPEGGRIVRDADGQATGYLIDYAMDLVMPLMPELDVERRREALRLGAETYASRGWTSVHNMSVDGEDLPLLKELAAAGELPLRVANFVTRDAMGTVIEEGPGCDATGLVCNLGVKFYADGALGSRGALLKEPYSDEPATIGLRLLTKDDAMGVYREAASNGLQITTHAIGDQANDDILSWYGELREDFPKAVLRIEHAQIVDPVDLDRFASTGVIASMQPSHAIGDLHFAPERLGMERLRGAYAWNSLAGEGTLIVFGSDAPVEQGDPRIELYAAHVRQDLEGFSGEGWHPEEALSRAEALALFTTSPALSIGRGGSIGTLAPGFAADLSIFEGDPFAGPSQARAVATMINGRWVSGEAQ
ncbi:amidohydrolase [Parvularcula sp. ZS-1/3]|uniref:Amidohydrolase n=1 Tax=Parvularcula mediterranea TaxID=2732508 RepID=A0A7Y3W6F3_9PROT|nr:amidohydrolase [Parvularcula mediterranea]NNU17211.1 amidohydrolase [Parvularcula mediterranea]